MTRHMLHATPETVSWGRFSAAMPPVLQVESGDTVVVECLTGGAELMPDERSGMIVPEGLRAIHAADLPFRWGHLLTGPIAIAGAEPGDMLEVRVDAIELGGNWGFNAIEPFDGTLPDDFIMPERVLDHIPIDRERRVATLPWGTDLPLAPFFGVMGVAPPPDYGEISSREPRLHGGNLDNKDLGAGATIFFPVWAEGGLFTVGDGHAVQGHGEVCVTALETCLTGTFTFVLHKRQGREPLISYPRAETTTHFISMGMHSDLDEAMRRAVREMIGIVTARTNLSREQAYQLCSLAADFHVTQSVNVEKGVHGMLARSLLA
ncbi:MAG: acetamidase/formamidase family protein [Bauldia sp.]|nr:acetamidase/formamidase family protein [Bauldia sp.]